jgi:transcription elongation GreA/GreB family factor
MAISKALILEKLIAGLEADLATLMASAREAHDAATNEEGRAEDQYDTRGLEASYLAGAQAKRASELQELIQRYKHLDLRSFAPNDTIAITALVEVESQGRRSLIFLVPTLGGNSVMADGKTIQILSSASPLGQELIGRVPANAADSEFEVELSGSQVREYRILSVS